MKIFQQQFVDGKWNELNSKSEINPQLCLVFGSTKLLKDKKVIKDCQEFFPDANVIFASTAGEIFDTKVNDNTISFTAIEFEKTKMEIFQADIKNASESYKVGEELASKLSAKNLVNAMVISDGLLVNGTDLVKGINDKLAKDVIVTGGLVGDGADFKETLVGFNDIPKSGRIVIIGFYGKDLKIGFGSFGGWDNFGPERKITKSKGNVLYELDDKPALALYKEYLGDKASSLPSSGLLFPLSLKFTNSKGNEVEIVRTLLAVDEKAQSMTFAGDMPENTVTRLMKANFDRLIDGSSEAAKQSLEFFEKPQLAVLISCIGRKLVLGERIEEEVEAVRSVLGENTALCGFYSYGELSPGNASDKECNLHNQTMTITTFKEE